MRTSCRSGPTAATGDGAGTNGFVRYFSRRAASPWLYNPVLNGGTFISYVDPPAVAAMEIVDRLNCGAWAWEISNEDDNAPGRGVSAVATTEPDEYAPILSGPGESDYERYLRTDELLALQKGPDEWVHRDELLFQTVHQSSELWLKHAWVEAEEATRLVEARDLAAANPAAPPRLPRARSTSRGSSSISS